MELAHLYLKKYFAARRCRSASVQISAKSIGDRFINMGKFELRFKHLPDYDHSSFWGTDNFPTPMGIKGENHGKTYLEFLDQGTSHAHGLAEVWSDIDPIRRTWASSMFYHLTRETLPLPRPDAHGHVNFDGFKFHAQFAKYEGKIEVREQDPAQARWTKELAINIFNTMGDLTHRLGVL